MNLKQIEKFFKIQCWFDGLNMSVKDIHNEVKLIKPDSLDDLDPDSQKLVDLYFAYRKVWVEKYGWSLDKCKKEISVIQTSTETPVKILKLTFIFSDEQVSYLHMISEFPYELKGVGVFTDTVPILRFGDFGVIQKKLDAILAKYCLTIPVVLGTIPKVDIPATDLVKFYSK